MQLKRKQKYFWKKKSPNLRAEESVNQEIKKRGITNLNHIIMINNI